MLLSIYSLLLTREELYNLIVDCEVSLESDILNSYTAEIGILDILDLEDALYYSNTIYLDNLLDLALTCSQNISSLNSIEFDQSISVMDYITTVNSGVIIVDGTAGVVTGLIPLSYQNTILIEYETTPTCTSSLVYNDAVNLDAVVRLVDTLMAIPYNGIVLVDESGSAECTSSIDYIRFITTNEIMSAEIDVTTNGELVVSSRDEFTIESDMSIEGNSGVNVLEDMNMLTQLSVYGFNQIEISESFTLYNDIIRSHVFADPLENTLAAESVVNLVYDNAVLVSCVININSTIKAFQYFKIRQWDMKARERLKLVASEKSLKMQKIERDNKFIKTERNDKWLLVNRGTLPWVVTILT